MRFVLYPDCTISKGIVRRTVQRYETSRGVEDFPEKIATNEDIFLDRRRKCALFFIRVVTSPQYIADGGFKNYNYQLEVNVLTGIVGNNIKEPFFIRALNGEGNPHLLPNQILAAIIVLFLNPNMSHRQPKMFGINKSGTTTFCCSR